MTRQQEYEAKLLREDQTDQIMPYHPFYPFSVPVGADGFFRNDQPFYIQLPLPDPFVSVSHVFG